MQQRKLYWRVKLNGKWTWRPAVVKATQYVRWPDICVRALDILEEEE